MKSALGTSRTMPADAASDPASLASVLDQIENLSISGGNGLSLNDVSAELRQMSLTSDGDQEDRQNLGPPVCTDVSVPPAGAGGDQSSATERVSGELGRMRVTSGGGEGKSECRASPSPAPGCS